MATDYYKTLGVSRNASQDEIQKAYRELARKYHPDMNPDDKTAKKRFQEVQTAFDVLGDSKKREMYDRYGSSFETMGAGGPQGAGWGPGAGGGFEGFSAEDVDFSQFFGDRFGGGGPEINLGDIFGQFRRHSAGPQRPRRGGRARGADVQAEAQIPFNTAVTGGDVELEVREPGGRSPKINVKIPAGIEDGKKIRLRGQGQPGPGGTAGDLLITVRVAPHPCFQRRGIHLHVKIPVTLPEAALGAKVDVPTPRGTVALRVPPGTSGGTKLRVKGHGVAPKNGQAGDLLAEIQIVLPDDFDEASREVIRGLDERYSENPRANLQW
jgi:DnaJ-class molecular chaperone